MAAFYPPPPYPGPSVYGASTYGPPPAYPTTASQASSAGPHWTAPTAIPGQPQNDGIPFYQCCNAKAGFLSSSRDPSTNQVAFITYRLYLRDVVEIFGESICPWNRPYGGAQLIFQGAQSPMIRGILRTKHSAFYQTSGPDVTQGMLFSGHDFLRLIHFGVPFGKRAYYTYVLTDGEFRFSETGVSLKDVFSKHALHSDTQTEVRYAGEFCIQECPRTGRYRMCIDNNSGTYGPPVELFPLIAQVLERNLPGLIVETVPFSDDRLPAYKATCDGQLIDCVKSVLALAQQPGDIIDAWQAVTAEIPRTLRWFHVGADGNLPRHLNLRVTILQVVGVVAPKRSRSSSSLAGRLRTTSSTTSHSSPTLSVSPRGDGDDEDEEPDSTMAVQVGVTCRGIIDDVLPCDQSNKVPVTGEDSPCSFDLELESVGIGIISGHRQLIVRLVDQAVPTGENVVGETALDWPQILAARGQPVWLYLHQPLRPFTSEAQARVLVCVNAAHKQPTPPPPLPADLGLVYVQDDGVKSWRATRCQCVSDGLRYTHSKDPSQGVLVPAVTLQTTNFQIRTKASRPGFFCGVVHYRHAGKSTQVLKISLPSLDATLKLLAALEAIHPQTLGELGFHNFKVVTFTSPTHCDYCTQFVWGILKQGSRCSNCGYNSHQKCLVSACNMPCVGSAPLLDVTPLDATVRKAHKFKVATFTTPTDCYYCKGFIWGVIKQGSRCQRCGYACHPKCLAAAKELDCASLAPV